MAKDISELFSQAVANFRAEQSRQQPAKEQALTRLERDFEEVKDQVRKLKPHIETHPSVNFFWIFTDRIIIDFRTGPHRPTVLLIVQLHRPGNNRVKNGMYGYLPCGYEMPLADVDEAVEFLATQCGKLLA